MIAFLGSFLLVAYLLAPPVVFRLVFSFFIPLKKFQRTRGEEVTFAAVVAVFPFVLAVFLITQIAWFSNHPIRVPQQPGGSYKAVVEALYKDNPFENQDLWIPLAAVARHQGALLFWYYLLLGLEAVLLGSLSRSYGRWHKKPLYAWVANRMLLPGISEWHLLLTPFALPPEQRQEVMADVLTSDDHLYRGTVADHYVDREGKLTGLLLKHAIRFDRTSYLRDKENANKRDKAQYWNPPQPDPKPTEYWKPIKGQTVYVFADKISNLNLSYRVAVPSVIEETLQRVNIPGTVHINSL